jgi:starch phosphorylase
MELNMPSKLTRLNMTDRGMIDEFKKNFLRNMEVSVGSYFPLSTTREKYMALAYTVRDHLISNWIKTRNIYADTNAKRVYYLSMEFLMGRTLGNALCNLEIEDIAEKALAELGLDLDTLKEVEWDAGLGNGGLGRLAACFLDSMGTMNLPAYGYGIRYEFGMFEQKIVDGRQKEFPDTWLRHGYPFEMERPHATHLVNFGGRVLTIEEEVDNPENEGQKIIHHKWVDYDQIVAVAYDVPIPGYKTDNVNTLRLWSARATRDFNLKTFDTGDYIGAVDEKNSSETISKVLYPNDATYTGRRLRFKQQYFMVSATMQDMIRRFKRIGNSIEALADNVVIQLNDTHPTLAIPELMRILLDVEGLSWDKAWEIVTRSFAFTNHTLMPEALEKWPVQFFEELLPRHLQIIYEINHRFLEQVSATYPGDFARREKLSIIEESDMKRVRMANLAVITSFSVNGVAQLHSQLMKEGIFKDFYDLFPEKFNNKTNGVTPRRWIRSANPKLSALISAHVKTEWLSNLNALRELEQHMHRPDFIPEWISIKQQNKLVLAREIKKCCNIDVNPESMFDVQVKRIHEYKRQLLNLMHCMDLYFRIKDNPGGNFTPRTVIFGGKAAPGYYMAKLIINLINAFGRIVNHDKAARDLLQVIFIPNYGVSLAEKIIPATDLAEHISTAGLEASGTSNMKFALNGALTIGTLDGANIEIMEEVGRENIFIFGHTTEQIRQIHAQGYNPHDYFNANPALNRVLCAIRDGYFSADQPDLFRPIYDSLMYGGDKFFLLPDFQLLVDCQNSVSELYKNQKEWHKKTILNAARMGKFSSDRVIGEYTKEIWGVKPCPVGAVL